MALELVCRADLLCNRHCKTSLAVLDAFWGAAEASLNIDDFENVQSLGRHGMDWGDKIGKKKLSI